MIRTGITRSRSGHYHVWAAHDPRGWTAGSPGLRWQSGKVELVAARAIVSAIRRGDVEALRRVDMEASPESLVAVMEAGRERTSRREET